MAGTPGSATIPNGLGLVVRQNALKQLSWRLLFAVIGILLSGFNSLGAATMMVPLVLLLSRWFTLGFGPYLMNRALFGFARKPIFVTFGPVLVKSRPISIRWCWSTSPGRFTGSVSPLLFRFSLDSKEFSRRLNAALGVGCLILGGLIVLFVVGLRDSDSATLAMLVGFAGLHSFRAVLWLHQRQTEYRAMSEDCFRQLVTALDATGYLQIGSYDDISAESLDFMERNLSESEHQLYALWVAYCVRTERGEIEAAAGLIKRSVMLADSIRMRQTPLYPDLMSQIYLEAAFHAATYGEDLDLAMRLFAIGYADDVDATSYCKSMTAIWVRLGNQPESMKWMERARAAHQWWRASDSFQEPHLRALSEVFATNSLKSISHSAIGPGFFAELERPTFCRVNMSNGLTKLSVRIFQWGCPVIILLFAFAAQHPSPYQPALIWLAGALVAASALSFAELLTSLVMEIRSSGIFYFVPTKPRWYPYDYVKSVRRKRKSPDITSLKIDVRRYRRDRRVKIAAYQLALATFQLSWPEPSLQEALRQKAPEIYHWDSSKNGKQEQPAA